MKFIDEAQLEVVDSADAKGGIWWWVVAAGAGAIAAAAGHAARCRKGCHTGNPMGRKPGKVRPPSARDRYWSRHRRGTGRCGTRSCPY